MAKVHPNAAAAVAAELATPTPTPTTSSTTGAAAAAAAADQEREAQPPTVQLTVWRKSLLFNCDGFTVFDAHGDLAFRVDSYARSSRRRCAEVVLMDAAGAPILTVRRSKRLLSLAPDRWLTYDGADDAADCTKRSAPLLTVRRHVGGGKTLAHVTVAAADSEEGDQALVVEGSYARRACAVRDACGDVVAEVRRKEALVGDDVFRLVVSSSSPCRLGAPLAMGLVIALDQMFAGRRSWLRRAY